MADTRGVFTLDRAFTRSKKGTWVTPEQSFFGGSTEPLNIGYQSGGSTPQRSTCDKLNLTSETTAANPSGNLINAMHQVFGVSNVNYGVLSGGNPSSTSYRISYATDALQGLPSANLSVALYGVGGTGNNQNGYGAGGANPTVSTTHRINYATDSTSVLPSAKLSLARHYIQAFGNSSLGYFVGGQPAYSTTDKLTYSTETTANVPGGNAPTNRYEGAGHGDEDNGFVSGGAPGSPYLSSTIKYTISTDTFANLPGGNMSVPRFSMTGAVQNRTDGYIAGGTNPSSRVSIVDRFSYSSETASRVPAMDLSLARDAGGNISARQNRNPLKGYTGNTQNLKGLPSPGFGYWAGAPGTSNVHKHYFATDSVGESSTNLNNTTYAGAGMSNANNFYLAGGNTPSKSIIERITYATDTCVQLSATIAQNAGVLFAYGNKDKGYVGGGANGGTLYSSVGRFDYSSETYTRVPGGDLVLNPLSVSAGAGTPSFGVFGGGTISGGTRISYFQKLQYSTETNTRIPSANLPTGTGNLTGTGTGYAGYRGGGETPGTISNISRHVYATDLVSYLTNSLPAGATTNFESIGSGKAAYWGIISNNMSKMNYNTETGYTVPVPSTSVAYSGAASAEEFDMPQPRPETPTLSSSIPGSVPNTGYLGGRLSPQSSEVQKIDFTTETTSTPTNRSQNAAYGGGNSSATDAYFGGGAASGPIVYSTMDKLTYSTDSLSAVPGAKLTIARYLFSGSVAGDSTKALWAGGYTTPATPRSTTDKLIFSSDTTSAVPGAALTASKYGITANASPAAGYVAGGSIGGGTRRTDIDKISMSTETTNRLPSANLPSTRTYAAGISYPRAGYFAGGMTPSAISEVMKLNFASDTLERMQNFPSDIMGTTATGNQSAAYFAGGQNPSYVTSTQKLEYSTETFTRSAADIPIASGYSAGASARSQGGRYTSNNL
jgi:hypothetical protein